MKDTIYALSSGALPAAIAVVRISGPMALAALDRLCRRSLTERHMHYRVLRGADGQILDRAMTAAFPGPATATGEDLVELYLHGGRAVVAAVLGEISTMPGLRGAEAGEFTRRAFLNGRIDLGQAEALSDLLAAETEWQRRAAADMAGGRFGQMVEDWRERLLRVSAMVEADLDFADEYDVAAQTGSDASRYAQPAAALASDVRQHLDAPPAEKLRDGVRVVLAGPPNSGKSSLLNALVARDAAIVSDIAGTTRDVIETPVAFEGIAFVISDTAGLREDSADAIEGIGIDRARGAIARSDILLWLGEEGEGPDHLTLLEIDAKSDLGPPAKSPAALRVSARDGTGVAALIAKLVCLAQTMLPPPDGFALNQRQRLALQDAESSLLAAGSHPDPLLVAEELRLARAAFDRLTGRTHTEDMLDRLFAGFCIGK